MKTALLLLLLNHGSLFVTAWLSTKAVLNKNNLRPHSSSFQRTATTTSSLTRSSSTAASSSSSSSSSSTTSFALPQLDVSHIQDLARQGYVIIPNFLPESLQAALRDDIFSLRSQKYFKQAKIGQDATNALNRNIRVAETCFLSQFNNNNNNNNNDDTTSSAARSQLLSLLQQIPLDLQSHADILGHADAKTRHIPTQQLDTNQATWLTSQTGGLHEWLYAYYPQGGFYRRHVDALPGSASTLRCYSLLLYLNDNQIWKQSSSAAAANGNINNGGQLRLHFDSGRDELPDGESPNYLDVDPYGGTLVLFSSRDIPHEVLDTNLERLAVVGWYNRIVLPSDVWELASNNSNGGGGDGGMASPQRLGMLAASATLILVGISQLM